MPDDDFTPYSDMLGEHGVPLYGFRLVSFIDDDGEERTTWKIDGEVSVMTTIGALESAKTSYIVETRAFRGWDAEDD